VVFFEFLYNLVHFLFRKEGKEGKGGEGKEGKRKANVLAGLVSCGLSPWLTDGCPDGPYMAFICALVCCLNFPFI
jgi:hypothetical protein